MGKGQFFQWSWNYKGNRLNKDIKKENFEGELINLIETNHQINMTSDHSASSNNTFKSHLNAKSSNTVAVVQSTVILLQYLLQGWCEGIRVMRIQLQEKPEKNPRHQQYQQKHHLMVIVMKKLLMYIKLVDNKRK